MAEGAVAGRRTRLASDIGMLLMTAKQKDWYLPKCEVGTGGFADLQNSEKDSNYKQLTCTMRDRTATTPGKRALRPSRCGDIVYGRLSFGRIRDRHQRRPTIRSSRAPSSLMLNGFLMAPQKPAPS